MENVPNSYKDPYWQQLASNAEDDVGLPKGLLTGILLYGEKSNNDQVSSSGARTPFQIIPSTRKMIMNKYGVDPYLSPENAAEGAALLLKESLDRNKGDQEQAIGEYHGGPDRRNWGPINASYRKRVAEGLNLQKESAADPETINQDIQNWLANNQTNTNTNNDTEIQKVKDIQDTYGKNIGQTSSPKQEDSPAPQEDNQRSTINADIQTWLSNRKPESAPASEPSIAAKIGDIVTGNLRATPETQSLPEWTGMPELNQLSMASAKTGLGTMFANPDEIAQVVKANFPDTQVSKDAKGNIIFKSSIDGKDYVIPPGFSMGDIPRAIGGLAAFTPAGRATSIAGGAASAAATQAAIEGSQAATGGSIDPGAILATGVVGGVAPPLLKGLEAAGSMLANPVKGAINRVMGREAAPVAESITAPSAGAAAPIASAPEVPLVNTTAPIKNAVNDVYDATRTAAQGGEQKIAELAQAVAPDKKTLQAAKDLGIDKYIMPDHISTNQQFIELAQVLKSVPSSQLGTVERDRLLSIGKKADDLIDTLGGERDLSTLNSNIKNKLSDTERDLKASAAKIYSEIDDKLLKTAAPAPAPNTLAFVKQRAEQLGGEINLTPGEKNILKVLTPVGGKEPTYGLLDQIRKEIGAAKRNAQNNFGTSDSKLLGDLENALRRDQGAVAESYGLGEKWQAAQSLAKQYKGLQDDLTALFGANIDKSIVGNLSGAVSALPKGDPSKFIKLVKLVPEDMRQQLTASGLATAFSKNKEGLNFNNYNQWFEGLLKNKQAYTALMSNLPQGSRKTLTDLYRVSKGVARSINAKIPTGRLTEGIKRLEGADTLAGKIMEAAKYDLPANLAGTASGVAASAVGGPIVGGSIGLIVKGALSKGPKLPGVLAAEKLLMSPEFMTAVQTAAKAGPKPAAAKLAKSPIFVDFVKKAKLTNLDTLSKRERWIVQALEANQQQSNSR